MLVFRHGKTSDYVDVPQDTKLSSLIIGGFAIVSATAPPRGSIGMTSLLARLTATIPFFHPCMTYFDFFSVPSMQLVFQMGAGL